MSPLDYFFHLSPGERARVVLSGLCVALVGWWLTVGVLLGGKT